MFVLPPGSARGKRWHTCTRNSMLGVWVFGVIKKRIDSVIPSLVKKCACGAVIARWKLKFVKLRVWCANLHIQGDTDMWNWYLIVREGHTFYWQNVVIESFIAIEEITKCNCFTASVKGRKWIQITLHYRSIISSSELAIRFSYIDVYFCKSCDYKSCRIPIN